MEELTRRASQVESTINDQLMSIRTNIGPFVQMFEQASVLSQ